MQVKVQQLQRQIADLEAWPGTHVPVVRFGNGIIQVGAAPFSYGRWRLYVSIP